MAYFEPLLAISMAFFIYRLKGLAHPMLLLWLSFPVPVSFARLRLSSLQGADGWCLETKLALLGALLVFVVGLSPLKKHKEFIDRKSFGSPLLREVVASRILSSVCLFSFYYSNYIQTGLLLPAIEVSSGIDVHVDYPDFWGTFCKLIFVAAIYSAYIAVRGKNRVDFWLCASALLAPLSRLARVDVFMSLVGVALILLLFKMFRWRGALRKGALVSLIAVVFLFVFAFAKLGLDRLNQFGVHEVSYSESIEFIKSDYSETTALFYGYFPMSFENFDRFVRQLKGRREHGAFSFSGILIGAFKLNYFFPSLENNQNLRKWFSPVARGATVPTAFAGPYLDYGIAGVMLFALMLVLLIRFWHKSIHIFPSAAVPFAVILSQVSLLGFQNILLRPQGVQALILSSFFFYLGTPKARSRKESFRKMK